MLTVDHVNLLLLLQRLVAKGFRLLDEVLLDVRRHPFLGILQVEEPRNNESFLEPSQELGPGGGRVNEVKIKDGDRCERRGCSGSRSSLCGHCRHCEGVVVELVQGWRAGLSAQAYDKRIGLIQREDVPTA